VILRFTITLNLTRPITLGLFVYSVFVTCEFLWHYFLEYVLLSWIWSFHGAFLAALKSQIKL